MIIAFSFGKMSFLLKLSLAYVYVKR